MPQFVAWAMGRVNAPTDPTGTAVQQQTDGARLTPTVHPTGTAVQQQTDGARLRPTVAKLGPTVATSAKLVTSAKLAEARDDDQDMDGLLALALIVIRTWPSTQDSQT